MKKVENHFYIVTVPLLQLLNMFYFLKVWSYQLECKLLCGKSLF